MAPQLGDLYKRNKSIYIKIQYLTRISIEDYVFKLYFSLKKILTLYSQQLQVVSLTRDLNQKIILKLKKCAYELDNYASHLWFLQILRVGMLIFCKYKWNVLPLFNFIDWDFFFILTDYQINIEYDRKIFFWTRIPLQFWLLLYKDNWRNY